MSRRTKEAAPPTKPPVKNPSKIVETIFPPAKLGTRVLVLGQPGSGKTSLVRWILSAHNFDSVIVFTGSGIDDEFSSIPNVRTVGGFNSTLIAKIIMFQQRTQPADRKRILLVFDDLLGETTSNGHNGELLAKAGALARKLNVTMLFIQQSVTSLNKTMRLTLDSVLITKIISEDIPVASKFTVGYSAKQLEVLLKTQAKLGTAFGFFNTDAFDSEATKIEFSR